MAITHTRRLLRRLGRDEGAATAIEYALLAAMVAVIAIAGMRAFGSALTNMWYSVTDTLTAAMGS